MVSVINRKAPYDPGSYFTKGLSTGLQNLAEYKINHMQHRQNVQKTAAGLRALQQGDNRISQETADALAELDPNLIREYVKNTTRQQQPLVNINNSPGVGEQGYNDFNKRLTGRLQNTQEGLNLVERLKEYNKGGHLTKGIFGYEPFGKSKESEEFANDIARLETYAKTHPELAKLSKRLKYNANPEAIAKELEKIENDFRKDHLDQEAANAVIEQNGGKIPRDFRRQMNDYLAQRQIQEQGESPQATASPQAAQQQSAYSPLRSVGNIAARGVQGLGEGITGLATAPFSIANLVSGGNIPIPEAVQSLQRLPGDIVKGVTGDLTTPQNDIEGALGETVQDVASFLSPAGLLGAAGKGANLLGKGSKWLDAAAKVLKTTPQAAAKIAGIGNAAKFLVKKAGGGENEQTAAKIGSMLLTPIIGSRMLGQEVNKLQQTAVNKIPSGAAVESQELFNKLNNLYRKVENLPLSSARDNLLRDMNKFPGARYGVKDLIDFEKSLQTITPELTATTSKLVPGITQDIGNALKKAAKEYPEFGKAYGEFNDLNNAAQASNKVVDFANKHIKSTFVRNPLITLGFAVAGVPKYKALGAVGAPTLAAGEVERLGRMVLTSPKFRELYGHTINAALQGNIKQFNELVERLGKSFAEEK